MRTLCRRVLESTGISADAWLRRTVGQTALSFRRDFGERPAPSWRAARR